MKDDQCNKNKQTREMMTIHQDLHRNSKSQLKKKENSGYFQHTCIFTAFVQEQEKQLLQSMLGHLPSR